MEQDPNLPVDPTYANLEGLTREHRILDPTQAFAERVRQVRGQKGWTQDDLAARLKTIGYKKLTRVVIAKIENAANRSSKAAKRERVTIEEVFAISLALGVSPLHLLGPYGDNALVQVAKEYRPASGPIIRGWLAGHWTLADEDPDFFYRQMPPEEIRQRMLEERERHDAADVYMRDEIERRRAEATGEMGKRMSEREARLTNQEEDDDG